MTRSVFATMLAALLLLTSCADDDDQAADTPTPTSVATSVDSETTAATTMVVASNVPTTSRVTTPVTSTPAASTSVPVTERGSTVAPPTVGTATTVGSNFAPVPEAPPPDEPVREGAASATELAVAQTCDPASPASPAVVLTWRPAAVGAQLVAVAAFPDGFDTGRYTVTDQLPAEQASYGISPVQPGGVYRWRVLARSADGWTASDIAEFTGPTCILDKPSSP